ncbi:MAG: hypothetical protein ACYTFO_10740, partial [Planctomycetota bacterium]
GIDTFYRLLENGCHRVTEGDTELGGDFRITEAGEASPVTTGWQAILDRMCALDTTERQAIIDFYNCAADHGLWSKIKNIWGMGLNELDHETSWLDDRIALDPTQTGPLVESPQPTSWQNDGTARTLFPEGRYYRTSNTCDAMFTKQISGMFHMLSGWATFDGNYLMDIYGAQAAGGLAHYNRWRGSALDDYDLVMGTDGPLPRPTLTVGPDDKRWGNTPGVIGGWSDQNNDYVAAEPNVFRSATRTFLGQPAEPLQFSGSNLQGVTQNQGAWVYLGLVVLISADTFDTTDAENLRECMLGFCRAIGTLDTPPT